MTIHFTTQPDDMGHFGDWYCTSTKAGKKLVRNTILFWSGIVWLICLVAFIAIHSSFGIYFIWEALIATILFAVVLPKRIVVGMRKRMVKAYSTPENLLLFGERTLELNQEGILSVSSMTTSLFKWNAIHEIATTPTHAFLMLGSLQAVIIPRATIQDGNFDAFVAEAQRLHAEATGKKTAIPLPAR